MFTASTFTGSFTRFITTAATITLAITAAILIGVLAHVGIEGLLAVTTGTVRSGGVGSLAGWLTTLAVLPGLMQTSR